MEEPILATTEAVDTKGMRVVSLSPFLLGLCLAGSWIVEGMSLRYGFVTQAIGPWSTLILLALYLALRLSATLREWPWLTVPFDAFAAVSPWPTRHPQPATSRRRSLPTGSTPQLRRSSTDSWRRRSASLMAGAWTWPKPSTAIQLPGARWKAAAGPWAIGAPWCGPRSSWRGQFGNEWQTHH